MEVLEWERLVMDKSLLMLKLEVKIKRKRVSKETFVFYN
jgi:hypothetical protein